ncbi:MAG: NUDIX domain-containing protein [Solirubrobacterales bacterium]|nr:NUDIX domain-containing protein [Solirubrobacterales bacterium]
MAERRKASSAGSRSRRRAGRSKASRPRSHAQSAGIVLYRGSRGRREVLLVHPGGPWWRRQDEGAWSIPKGEGLRDEEPYSGARREFAEELGVEPPEGEPLFLGEITQKAGKRVVAWALAGDLDTTAIRSNAFSIEWPPRSGELQAFPEVDRAEWFSLAVARDKVNPAQVELLDRLEAALE